MPEYEGEEWVEVEPINHIQTGQSEYHYEYRFDIVPIDEIDEDINLPGGVDIERIEDGIRYQYKEREPIIIQENRCLRREGGNRKDAEKQTYHALSILDSEGFMRLREI